MKKFVSSILIAGLFAAGIGTSMAASGYSNFNPKDDASNPAEFAKEFRNFYYQNFPQIPHDKYNLGVYAFDKDAYTQYQDMMQFPPQDDYIAAGKKLWADYRLPNGKPLASCVGDAKGLRAKYPYFNPKDGQVHNLELDLINCQLNAGVPKDKSWGSKKGYKDLVAVSAYLASESRGMKVDVQIPNDPRAVEAFNSGKQMWFRKTGQLNLSCADCHMYHATQRTRAEILHTGIGNTTSFPVFRYGKQKMFTLDKRLKGCMRDTRTIPFKPYSTQYRDLEYFLAYIDNGLVINGPGLRK
jgi:sulfur-oxidizing protein SoxA